MRYCIVPTNTLAQEQVLTYWKALELRGLLKYRFCETHNPGWDDVVKMYSSPGMAFYMVVDTKNNEVAGECAFENFMGLSAIVHYSIHPEYHGKEAITLTKEALEMLFLAKREKGLPYLASIVGMTPKSNKLALKHIQKVGFEVLCSIPKAIYLAYADFYDDVILSVNRGLQHG